MLIDTNCWMQIARQRPQADDVLTLLAAVPMAKLFVSDFTVHSLGVLFRRFGMMHTYTEFLEKAFIGAAIGLVHVPQQRLALVQEASLAHNLDFDDAYQYVLADLINARVVSLDPDFDRTPRGRLTPSRALEVFRDEQAPQ